MNRGVPGEAAKKRLSPPRSTITSDQARETADSHSPPLLVRPPFFFGFFFFCSVSPSQQACFLFLLVLGEKGAKKRKKKKGSQEESSLEELERSNLPSSSAGLVPHGHRNKTWTCLSGGIFNYFNPISVRADLMQRLCFPSPSPGTWEGDSTSPG